MKRQFYIILAAALVLIAACAAAVMAYSVSDDIRHQQNIAASLIRFHIRANSDTQADQRLKLEVRDDVIAYLKPLLAGSGSIEQSRRIICNNQKGITDTAANTIAKSGKDYAVRAYFTKERFPTREYGAITLPAGEYEAFRIDVGEASGHNWWCVLYPPLCFEDATHAVLDDESTEYLKSELGAEEYDMIMSGSHSSADDVRVRFRIFKFLNKYF